MTGENIVSFDNAISSGFYPCILESFYLQRNAFIEVCLVPRTSAASQFPGLFIFSDVARLMRPVLNLRSGQREWIGTFEQPYLAIGAAGPDPVEPVSPRFVAISLNVSLLPKLLEVTVISRPWC